MVAVLLPMLRAFTCKSSDQLHHPQCSRHWAERSAHPVYTCFQIELTEGIPTPYVYQRTLELQILPKTVPLMNHEPWFEEETWAFPLCLDFLWGLHPGLQPSNRKTPCLRWLSVLGNHDWGGAAGMDFWIYKWAIKKSWLLIVLGIAAAEILPNYIVIIINHSKKSLITQPWDHGNVTSVGFGQCQAGITWLLGIKPLPTHGVHQAHRRGGWSKSPARLVADDVSGHPQLCQGNLGWWNVMKNLVRCYQINTNSQEMTHWHWHFREIVPCCGNRREQKRDMG